MKFDTNGYILNSFKLFWGVRKLIAKSFHMGKFNHQLQYFNNTYKPPKLKAFFDVNVKKVIYIKIIIMLIFPKCWCQINCYKHASNMPNVLIPNICLYELNSNYLHLTLKCFLWLRYGPCIFPHCPLLSKHYLLPNTHLIITLKH